MPERRSQAQFPPPQPASDDSSYLRLHVTPLDAELLNVVLSSALVPKARNISYHAIETFPEKRYGFLELPHEEAEKLPKKLNGAVLKGIKIRIQPARPSRIPSPLGQAAMAKEKPAEKPGGGVHPEEEKKRKRKRDVDVLGGIVLEDSRKIKRGWTAPDEPKEKRSNADKRSRENKGKEKKKQAKSKYTDHAECLLKTLLPANAATSTDSNPSSLTKKKKKGKLREVVVHEFEKTTRFPTFLKATVPASRSTAPLEFIDGKGWFDEHGNLVEAVRSRSAPTATISSPVSTENGNRESPSAEKGTTTSPNEDESSSGSEPDSPAPKTAELGCSPPSSSPESARLRPKSSGSVASLSIKIPPTTPNEPKIHPLEALYKCPKQPDGEVGGEASSGQGFSFFANGGDGSGEEEDGAGNGDAPGVRVLTPFTSQDLQLRGIRSAAPTPDTAHPNRRFVPWENDDDGEPDDGLPFENPDQDRRGSPLNAAAQASEDGEKPASDFQKWFWENRGDLNRSWKKRRKLASKEKRYRENKARMARAI